MSYYILLFLLAVGIVWLIKLLVSAFAQTFLSKLAKARMKRRIAARRLLLEQAPGGTAQNPISISTPSLVEPTAAGYLCPICENEMRLIAHRAIEYDEHRLRLAELKCFRCEFQKDLYFKITSPN